jgi:hypothetical protein
VLYTGTGAALSITGVGFQPDFVWTKLRSQAGSHSLADVIRGGTAVLRSDSTAAEVTRANHIQSFDADGFTLGADGTSNLNGTTNVAWNWKASNATAVSNTEGTITSQVSANPTAGFSIVSYTGTGSAATVGHGLGAKPDLMIIKERDGVANWIVYHQSLTADKFMILNLTNAEADFTPIFNDTEPTSSVFTVGTNGDINGSADQYIAYCFHSVEGYSKFSSYTGNGSADGPFVYTGFRPAWVMVKRTDVANNWLIFDTERDVYNVAGLELFANLSDAENNNKPEFDMLSNGFKCRYTYTGSNASGGTYIYMAFAENPFKYSVAR